MYLFDERQWSGLFRKGPTPIASDRQRAVERILFLPEPDSSSNPCLRRLCRRATDGFLHLLEAPRGCRPRHRSQAPAKSTRIHFVPPYQVSLPILSLWQSSTYSVHPVEHGTVANVSVRRGVAR